MAKHHRPLKLAFQTSGPKIVDTVVGGWQLTGTCRYQSGSPVVFGTNYFFDGQEFALPGDKRSLDQWFDTSHFYRYPGRSDDISKWPAWTGVQNLPGANFKPTLANDPANSVYQDFGMTVWREAPRWAHVHNPALNETDLGTFKNYRIWEYVKTQFRCEALNALTDVRQWRKSIWATATSGASRPCSRISPTSCNSH